MPHRVRTDLRPVIRRAPHNHPALRALHDACFQPSHRPVWSAGTWWLAWSGGRPVAFAGVVYLPRRRCWYLCRAGVVPSARGLGLQRRLIRVRERFVRARARRGWLVTYTLDDNVHSSNNLVACGYRLYLPPRRRRQRGALYFRKPL